MARARSDRTSVSRWPVPARVVVAAVVVTVAVPVVVLAWLGAFTRWFGVGLLFAPDPPRDVGVALVAVVVAAADVGLALRVVVWAVSPRAGAVLTAGHTVVVGVLLVAAHAAAAGGWSWVRHGGDTELVQAVVVAAAVGVAAGVWVVRRTWPVVRSWRAGG